MSETKVVSNLICPIMSCRVTQVSDPTAKEPKIAPTVVMCQEDKCAWWDQGNKVCCALRMVMELTKGG